MKTIIELLTEKIKENLVRDMHDKQYGDDVTLLVLAAYNRYQEDEKDGVDYIFNINNKEDLKCCIDGGMTPREISCLFTECTATAKSTPFFMFGCNHPQAETLVTWDALKTYLTNFLLSIIEHMLAYPYVKEYRNLYDHCIREYMINNNLV